MLSCFLLGLTIYLFSDYSEDSDGSGDSSGSVDSDGSEDSDGPGDSDGSGDSVGSGDSNGPGDSRHSALSRIDLIDQLKSANDEIEKLKTELLDVKIFKWYLEKTIPPTFIAFSIWYGYLCPPQIILGGVYESSREHVFH